MRERGDRSGGRGSERGRAPLPPPPPPRERPPEAPREMDPDPSLVREFEMDGIRWAAWVAGKSAGGTGPYGLGMLEAVHFAHADEADRPRFEALQPRGRFTGLYDDELRALLRGSVRIVVPDRDGDRR